MLCEHSHNIEAYNDFSKFDSIEFTTDVYEYLHEIEDKSISGTLAVNIFGGGTIDTERHFITGFYSFPSFRKSTNSYATYFKEQGYATVAMHPIYGAFYNRNTANLNMGFDSYWNYENKYSDYYKGSGFAPDNVFFTSIIENMEDFNQEGTPYFNFSVTYQNHGPYSTDAVEETYIENKGYSADAYNMFNRYLSGIKSTNEALKELVDYLENYDYPTILIVFGDHNPYLGEANYVYKELGIDMTLTSLDSFINYYTTPYFIFGNEAARNELNKDFIGENSTISPNFLMNEMFEYVGWKGNEYLKYTSYIKSKVDVIHSMYTKENNEYVTRANSTMSNLINEYQQVSYYYANNRK